MIAIMKHELKLYSHNFLTYIFGACLLIFIGLGSLFYNLTYGYANFEYALGAMTLAFVVLIPILTMRVISEEKKQKTDQLLYSLPISSTSVVLGKFFAMAIVYFIPLVFVCFYPIMFSAFGDVYLPIAYSTLFAFFFLGLALISIGEFISSLTESQGIAAGICAVAMLFNYYSATLADYVSSTAIGSLIALLVVVVLIGVIVKVLTKSTVAGGVSVVILAAAILVAYIVDATVLEDLLPTVLHELSLFERFQVFIDGIFDIKVIIYDISVIVFFLFLTVQSLEKRRYN